MRFFDCDVAYGRGAIALPREIETPGDLIAEMDHCDIAEGLVWHRDAFERDFDRGNRRLEEVASFPRLHPTRTFVPPCSDEMPTAEDFVAAMQEDGVRAARAFPARHCFCLDAVSCGALLELLVAHSIPLLVPLAEFPQQWQDVYALLRSFPRLTLVLTETGGWGQDRYFRPLLREYPRLHITTHRLETAGQLKGLVNTEGAERILFGSGLPRNCPGGYILMLARADIAPADKAAIAHGNLDRLLKEAP